MGERYFVYKILNDVNDKVYIGQTTESLENRFKRHCGYQIKDGTYFHRAIKKYGASHFHIELVKECFSQEELNEEEYKAISSYPKSSLYNTKYEKGKCGGDTLSNNPNKKLIAKKLSESKIGEKNPRSRIVKATNVSTGETLIFGSALEAVRELIDPFSEDHSPVTRRCRGKIKKFYRNVWKFEYI